MIDPMTLMAAGLAVDPMAYGGVGVGVGVPPLKKARLAPLGGGVADGGVPAVPEGEVRFESPQSVQTAALMLQGSILGGSPITVMPDASSKDGTKVIVSGFGPQVMWQELKDHLAQCGTVIFADVKGQFSGFGGKGKGKGSPYPSIGEVRMSTAEEAMNAIQMLNGSALLGSVIEVKLHGGSTDQTKVSVTGIPPGCAWQELKDYFGQCGTVIHADCMPIVPGEELRGEVRYDDPQHAQLALRTLNGSMLGASQIFVQTDPMSTDGSKLTVTGIAPGTDWRNLKDLFATIGTVAFADVKGGGKGFKGGKPGAVFGGGKGVMAVPMVKGGGGKGFAGCQGAMVAPVQGGLVPGQAVQYPRVDGASTGTIRYVDPASAQMAAAQMNGQVLNGGQLTVDLDWNSQDFTKLWVGGIPPGTGWQDLKDFFAQCGQVAYANVNDKGKGKGKMMMGM